MSILTVEHLSHGFGDRAIFTDVSFRLLKGEHIGLIGANGEGKSTFMTLWIYTPRLKSISSAHHMLPSASVWFAMVASVTLMPGRPFGVGMLRVCGVLYGSYGVASVPASSIR